MRTISRVNFEGRDRKTVVESNGYLDQPFGLAVFEVKQHYRWKGDWRTHAFSHSETGVNHTAHCQMFKQKAPILLNHTYTAFGATYAARKVIILLYIIEVIVSGDVLVCIIL